ncbi:hypothetical protein [Robertkochia solimangrovi]|uniref:hypothetical protein n=1 Tax=Robertkochia solimangrovi TaxID=2213046 RepID=UPI00117FCDF0|nr:hypothetical protein [Robertkochia solimangrovi]
MITGSLCAQEELFGEFELKKNFHQSEKWTHTGVLNYKHIYNSIGWRRFAIYAFTHRKLNEMWILTGGLSVYYRFDREIENFIEVKPWIGIRMHVPITEDLVLLEHLRLEWRNFLLGEHQNYFRTRFLVHLKYTFNRKPEENTFWNLQGGLEWYLLKDPILRERYANSRKYTLRLSKHFTNGSAVIVGYDYEKFYNIEITNKVNGHTIFLGYQFN